MNIVHRLAVCWFPAVVALASAACAEAPDSPAGGAQPQQDDPAPGHLPVEGGGMPWNPEVAPPADGACAMGQACVEAVPDGWEGPAVVAFGEDAVDCPAGWPHALDLFLGEVVDGEDGTKVALGDPAILCTANAPAACNTGVCAASAPEAFAQVCVYQTGELACPAAFPDGETLFPPNASTMAMASAIGLEHSPEVDGHYPWQTVKREPITVCCAE